jgi:butyrate response factor 1
MTTEYYQIPSQQGLLPLDSSPDPWLASATSTFASLSLTDAHWGVKTAKHNPPSLFEPGTADALSWKHVVPMHNAGTKAEVKAPKVPKNFHSTTSKIDAWSVVDNVVSNKQQTKRNTKTQPANPPSSPALALAPVPVPAPTPAVTAEDKANEEELVAQNISFLFLIVHSPSRSSYVIFDSSHRYKTELCKSFTETGVCRYGVKCQFAHGKEEIRPILRHPKYKTEVSFQYHTTALSKYKPYILFDNTKDMQDLPHHGNLPLWD